jgi:quercetin dioxygenase-like cupin family protein
VQERVTLVYQHELPNAEGKSMKAVVVAYGPGGRSVAHCHPASAFVYAIVLEGAVASQVNDGPVKIYRAGESFVEMPGDVHRMSANASKVKPAKLVAVFVVDTTDDPLVTPLRECERASAASVARNAAGNRGVRPDIVEIDDGAQSSRSLLSNSTSQAIDMTTVARGPARSGMAVQSLR